MTASTQRLRAGLRRRDPRTLGGAGTAVHLAVGSAVCFLVLSPALFTPWGFGKDYSNHIWLVWQQGLAISSSGHPTLYLQQQTGVFQPLYGFYGATLYAVFGGLSAALGNDAYVAFIIAIGLGVSMAYGGTWWLGRLIGLGRWAAHLPAFTAVTSAYYLTDAYARGAWPEFMALSAVPLFLAGGVRLMGAPWRSGPVALFVVATVVMTGSHNLTLFWTVVVVGPVGLAAWMVAGRRRFSLRAVAAVAALAVVALGVNAWFLVFDLSRSSSVRAGHDVGGADVFLRSFHFFYTWGNILGPFRSTPAQSGTFGLAIAAPVLSLVLSVVLIALAWPEARREERNLWALWLVVVSSVAALAALMAMPSSWWIALGPPWTYIQFPYRLAGWLLLAMAVQLALALRLVRAVRGSRRLVGAVLMVGFVSVTSIQTAAQLYSGPRLDGQANDGARPHEVAFANGPTTAPDTYYDGFSYADASLPEIPTRAVRTILIPAPRPGATSARVALRLPPGRLPFSTNIAAGPYAVRIDGLRLLGRTPGGAAVLAAPPPAGRQRVVVVVTADAGQRQRIGTIITLACVAGVLGLLGWLSLGHRPRRRSGSPR